MSDLISRISLKQSIVVSAILKDKKTLEQIIDEEPSIDAVPVVRCEDCKYYGRVDKRRFYRGGDCTKGIISTIVPDKDFCSRGERKES